LIKNNHNENINNYSCRCHNQAIGFCQECKEEHRYEWTEKEQLEELQMKKKILNHNKGVHLTYNIITDPK